MAKMRENLNPSGGGGDPEAAWKAFERELVKLEAKNRMRAAAKEAAHEVKKNTGAGKAMGDSPKEDPQKIEADIQAFLDDTNKKIKRYNEGKRFERSQKKKMVGPPKPTREQKVQARIEADTKRARARAKEGKHGYKPKKKES